MGSIVSLLVLGAIYSVVFVVKNLGGKEGGKPFGESFPTIDVFEPESETATPASQVVVPTRTVETQRPCNNSVVHTPNSTATTTPANKLAEPAREGRLVKLGNKSEAKRAFLYSEIFNRKY